jgi:hypothetical protein
MKQTIAVCLALALSGTTATSVIAQSQKERCGTRLPGTEEIDQIE